MNSYNYLVENGLECTSSNKRFNFKELASSVQTNGGVTTKKQWCKNQSGDL
jgi:hypothetical protein